MENNKFNFTTERLRKISAQPGKKRSYYYDLKRPGLRLQVTAAGTKTFQFQARYTKKRRPPATVTLGRFPDYSINWARNKTIQLLEKVNEGIDVEQEINQSRQEDTFSTLFNSWLEQFAKPHKRSWREDERRYKLYMEKPFGKKQLSWFSPSKIRKWHSGITEQKKQRGQGMITPSTANRALVLLSTVFNQAAPEISNPCKGVKKFKEQSRDRFLQPNELKRFFDALSHPDTPTLLRDYILFSLFTGARRANVLSVQWKEISFERSVWTIPGSKSKNGEDMVVPLTDEAMEILVERKKNSKSVFVFPGNGKKGHYAEPKRAWKTLLKNASLTNVRIHDLRRTLGSYQTITGASSTVVGKTLGHKSPEATAVYARLNLDPVRASMETAIKAMLATKELPEKVVSIGTAKEG